MPSGRLLRKLIETGAEGDVHAFRRLSEEVIAEERDKQHHLLANDLEKILYGRPVSSSQSRGLSDLVPKDSERGFPLLTVRQPTRTLDDVVLSDDLRETLEMLLLEYHREETLRSFGLRANDRMLFVGPPGCGKTLTAEAIATELNRHLAIIRLDAVVSSYLGETAANLRRVFDFISNHPLVALFDEFDSLGKERDNGDEHGELKRVVNAVLQMFDDYRGRSLIIAATNHEKMLDSALWRRFDEVLVFKGPNVKQIQCYLRLKLRSVRRDFDIDDPAITALFKAYSYADIERILRRAVKIMILNGIEFLNIGILKQAISRERDRSVRAKS